MSECELCAGGYTEDGVPLERIKAEMAMRGGRITICPDHLASLKAVGYRFGQLSSPTRPNRHARRAAKRTNLTRAQRKAAG